MHRYRFLPLLALPVLCSLVLFAQRASAVSCNVVHHGPPSEADKALLAANYDKAASLYQTALATHPADSQLTIGLVHALLHQQKIEQAADTVKAALKATPNSTALMTLRGEVEFRQGEPWTATQTVADSFKLDPCDPRTRLLFARVAQVNSMYATARKQIIGAHKLDPEDIEIREEWIDTLPSKQRISELEAYLANPTGSDAEDLSDLHEYLDRLKKQANEPHKACHLVSPVTSAEIPFIKLMYDGTHVRAYGLEVKLNNHAARLQIDTGAGGLLISRGVAERAGLKPFAQTRLGGVGDHGSVAGYSAYVDSIRIGGLEFQNCSVRVIEGKNNLDVDGLIGTDVFSQFLVTLDYPWLKLVLGPLPTRPGETVNIAPRLQTDSSDPASEQDESSDQSASSTTPPAIQPPATAPSGPHDRYIAPEMKEYSSVYRVGHDLIIPAALNDKTQRLFILDTGAFESSISPQAAREVTGLHSAIAEVTGISGKVNKSYTSGQITFKFAHMSQTSLGVIAFDTSNISRGVGMEISGLIGYNTLHQLTMHIDYRDGLVKFEFDPTRGYQFY